MIYPKSSANQTCDYWLIIPNQQDFILKLISFNSGQLQIREWAITKQWVITVNGAMSIAINRVIKLINQELPRMNYYDDFINQ